MGGKNGLVQRFKGSYKQQTYKRYGIHNKQDICIVNNIEKDRVGSEGANIS